jgi:hypothetical protein
VLRLHTNNLDHSSIPAILLSRKLHQANILALLPTSRPKKRSMVNTRQPSSPSHQASTLLARPYQLLGPTLQVNNLIISTTKRTVRIKPTQPDLFLKQPLLNHLISPATIVGAVTTGLKIALSLEELYLRKMFSFLSFESC